MELHEGHAPLVRLAKTRAAFDNIAA